MDGSPLEGLGRQTGSLVRYQDWGMEVWVVIFNTRFECDRCPNTGLHFEGSSCFRSKFCFQNLKEPPFQSTQPPVPEGTRRRRRATTTTTTTTTTATTTTTTTTTTTASPVLVFPCPSLRHKSRACAADSRQLHARGLRCRSQAARHTRARLPGDPSFLVDFPDS